MLSCTRLRHSRIVEGSVACRQELVYLWEARPLSEMTSSVFALVFTFCIALSHCDVSLSAFKQQDLIKGQEKCGKVSEYFGQITLGRQVTSAITFFFIYICCIHFDVRVWERTRKGERRAKTSIFREITTQY